MKGLPFFKWYPADADTDASFRAMDDSDIGFYIRCLNHSWINEGIPADPKERARVMRTRLDTANKRWERVGKCFVTSSLYPERLINLRQETERGLASQKSLMAAKSVNVRYERKSNVAPRAIASESESEYKTPKPPAPDGAVKNGNGHAPKKARNRKAHRTTEEIESDLGTRITWWEKFWEVYPSHEAKNEAMDAFERRVNDRETALAVYAGAKRYSAKVVMRLQTTPTFTAKYAQGWLNNERWRDDSDGAADVQRQIPFGTDPSKMDGYQEFK